ncbi:hypothetical protein YPPY02_1034, partial [Yersinia pestis PY-02]
MWLEVWRGGG